MKILTPRTCVRAPGRFTFAPPLFVIPQATNMRTFVLALLLAFSSLTVTAQQYGHVNFATILSELPGTSAAETDLEAYNEQLVKKGRELVEKLKADVAQAEANYEDMSPNTVNEVRKKLERQQDEIMAYERQLPAKIEQRRQQLLGPLIQQVKDAIEATAKAEGLLLVFDTSIFNAVLFADDSVDITDAVKARLAN